MSTFVRGSGGGENLNAPLTELETTLQQVLDILPFKGAMASGIEVIEVTPASDVKYITVQHNLGVVPSRVFMVIDGFPSVTYRWIGLVYPYQYQSGASRHLVWWRASSTSAETTTSRDYLIMSENDVAIGDMQEMTTYYFEKGKTYRVYLMA